MAHDPSRSPLIPAAVLPARLRFGDSAPMLVAHERDSDSVWNLWSDAVAEQEVRFAPTVPDSLPLTHLEPGFAATTPLALLREVPANDASVGAAGGRNAEGVTIDTVLALARRYNRICPRPDCWWEMYEMLPNKRRVQGNWEPPTPLIFGDWVNTPSLPKRMCFREHIEWAAREGCLRAVYEYLSALEEDQWHHFGG